MKTVFSMLLAATLINLIDAYANTINTDEAFRLTSQKQVKFKPVTPLPAPQRQTLQACKTCKESI